MTVVNPKSISGITSITTPSGGDNLLTIHTSDTTERVRVNNSGDVIVGTGLTLSPDGDVYTTGVTTATTFVGALTGNVTGNLSGNVTGDVTGTSSKVTITSGSNNRIVTAAGADTLQGETNAVINGGVLIVGHTAGTTCSDGENPFIQVKGPDSRAGASYIRHSADASAGGIYLGKSRNATIGSNTIVQDDDELGRITFSGDDGTDINTTAAKIAAYVDATPGANDMPGSLRFYTTADGASSVTERLRITSAGLVQIGLTGMTGGDDQALTVNNPAGNANVLELSTSNSSGRINCGRTLSNTLNTTSYIEWSEPGAQGTGDIRFGTSAGSNSPAERLRIGSDGTHTMSGTSDGVLNINTTDSRGGFIRFGQGGSYHNMVGCADGLTSGDKEDLGIRAADQIIFATNGSNERARFTNDGSFCVSCTGGNVGRSDEGISLNADGAMVSTRDGVMHYFKSLATGGYTGIQVQSANTVVGSMTFNSGGTAWNTTSDYRLKENQVAISDGITRLKTLKPYRFNFKNNSSKILDGFFAHEVTAVPEAVSGTKDAVATEADSTAGISIGDPIYQQIDQSKLVPLLTAALQEAIAEIETLKTKVAALESA